MMELNKNIL
jgi:dynein heavy chain